MQKVARFTFKRPDVDHLVPFYYHPPYFNGFDKIMAGPAEFV